MKKLWVILGVVVAAVVIGGLAVARMTSTVSEPLQPEIVVTPGVKVRILQGTATVNGLVAVEGMTVKMGDVVVAGEESRITLVYTNGSQTRLDSKAIVTIKTLESEPFVAKVELEEGRIWSRLVRLVAGETYQSESSTVVATVRGTSYGHGILKDGTNRVVTTKGKVESDCEVGDQAGLVKPGEEGFLNCSTEPMKLEILTEDELNDEWMKFNAEQDKLQELEVGGDKFDETDVLGLSTENEGEGEVLGLFTPVDPLITCTGPDGIVFQATQANCDNLNEFWRLNAPTNTASNNASNPSSVSTDQPQPTLTPTLPSVAISRVTVVSTGVVGLAPTHRKFAWIESVNAQTVTANPRVKAVGENFNSLSRLEVVGVGDGITYNEASGHATAVTSAFPTRVVLEDFTNLPCGSYDVWAYFENRSEDPRTAFVKNQYLCTTATVDNVTLSEEGLDVSLDITGTGMQGLTQVRLYDQTNNGQPLVVTDGVLSTDLFASFSGLACGKTYEVEVLFFDLNNLAVEWNGEFGDANRQACSPLDRVEISPSDDIFVQNVGEAVSLVANTFDVDDNLIFSEVEYVWGGDVANLGTLTATGSAVLFESTNRGQGTISVVANRGAESVSSSVPVTVGSGMTGATLVEACVPDGKIGWNCQVQADGYGLGYEGLYATLQETGCDGECSYYSGEITSSDSNQLTTEFLSLAQCQTFDITLFDPQNVLDTQFEVVNTACPPPALEVTVRDSGVSADLNISGPVFAGGEIVTVYDIVGELPPVTTDGVLQEDGSLFASFGNENLFCGLDYGVIVGSSAWESFGDVDRSASCGVGEAPVE